MDATSDHTNLATFVRERDYGRYLATVFAPEHVRVAHMALLAWYAEIVHIPHAVREEMLGHIRYAWWREALDEIYGNRPVRAHPALQALADIVQAHELPRALFDAIIDAQESWFVDRSRTQQWEKGEAALYRLLMRLTDVPLPDVLPEQFGGAYAALYSGDKTQAVTLPAMPRHYPKWLRAHAALIRYALRKRITPAQLHGRSVPILVRMLAA